MNNKAKERIDNAVDELCKLLDEGKSESLCQYLDCMSRFHQYSWCNVLLIGRQMPDATRVAGFRKWQELNRYVRKGEKGIAIVAPMLRRRTKEPKHQEDDESRVTGFRTVHVFDVSQTEGEPLPALPEPSGDAGELLECLEGIVRESNIELLYEPLSVDVDGYSVNGRIGIDQSLNDVQRCVVLVHELAHQWLEHHAQPGRRNVVETEAEAVAYVVCRASGLQVPGSRDYIQLYQGDSEMLRRSLGRIQSVAGRILKGIHSYGSVACNA